MGTIRFDEFYIFWISIKIDSVDSSVVIIALSLKLLVTIEPRRSLLTFRYQELFEQFLFFFFSFFYELKENC